MICRLVFAGVVGSGRWNNTAKVYVKFAISIMAEFIAMAFLIGRFTGLNTNVTTLMMVAFSLPALLIGFFKKQGLGFIDYARKYLLVRKYKDLIWVSTEDPAIEEVCSCRRMIPSEKENRAGEKSFPSDFRCFS